MNQELYLDPTDADAGLRHFLNGRGEEQRDRETDGGVQRHSHKHAAGSDFVSHQHVHSERHKLNDLACRKEGGHVQTTQVGAAHDFRNLFPGRRREHHKG